MSQACNALELDYCEVEFTNHFPTRDPLLEHLVRTLGKEVEAGVTGSGYLYAGQLLQTIAVHLVSKYTAGEPTARVYQGGMPNFRLRRIEDYVRTHLAEEIGIEDLANEVGLSRWHFSRTFEQATGEAPSRYVQRLRMEQAIYLLQTTDLPITEVAYAVGYTSLSHFTKLFKHRFGTTPGTYQRCRSR
ncbi:AraC family transcriptional regulator [Oculatella sp. FACHB-28]|uniref:helix-turn-helix domain-containing protein n=1 Tax=Oculatella sp. FACHB-28 TaxID=2692845 RepID=UPI0016822603